MVTFTVEPRMLGPNQTPNQIAFSFKQSEGIIFEQVKDLMDLLNI
jgi:hypothetical protein